MANLPEWIRRYRDTHGLTQQDLADVLNRRMKLERPITKIMISQWEHSRSQPDYAQVLYLGLLAGVVDPYATFIDEVHGYRLNQEGMEKLQAMTDEYVQLLEESGLYSPAPPRLATRTIKVFNQPVSAGLGEYLDGDDYTPTEVDGSVPIETDFGVPIKGDSMKPRFVDTQVVWVRKQQTIENGEIGIFFYDGDGFIKRFESDRDGAWLVSLNHEYSPIQLREGLEFRVYGKVLA